MMSDERMNAEYESRYLLSITVLGKHCLIGI